MPRKCLSTGAGYDALASIFALRRLAWEARADPDLPLASGLLLRRLDEARTRCRLLRPLSCDDPIPEDLMELIHERLTEVEGLPLGVDLRVRAHLDHPRGRRHPDPTQTAGGLSGIGLADRTTDDHQVHRWQLIA